MAKLTEVRVPDIGDFTDVPIIEISVSRGDTVSVDAPLVTLETDKATMDVPSPFAGVIRELAVNVGDSVAQDSLLLTMDTDDSEELPAEPAQAAVQEPESASPAPAPAQPAPAPTPYAASAEDPRAPRGRPSPTATLSTPDTPGATQAHATPGIRRYARELGVELSEVKGTGRKGRVLKADVNHYVKAELAQPRGASGGARMGIEPIPAVDFAKFGEIETRPLSRIQKLSGPHLHRAWLNVPHVTHHDEADVTALEAFRKSLKDEAAKQGLRVTALAFIMKAVAATLREFPGVNSSLAPDGESLVVKKYFHIGIAVDTPNGLVVPVFRDVDTKTIYTLAAEMSDLSARARDAKLRPDEMQGGCMSISSLGGIGGTAFTPIVNAPEAAILGVTRSRMTPVWNGAEFQPRLMLPLSLSYDHRVVDGAEAARFMAHLCRVLGDVRRLLL